MNALPSDTFCILPWIHLYVNPNGEVLPCCVGDYANPMGTISGKTIEEIFNNDRFKTMRSNMLQGNRCDECKACYRDEDAGNSSFRKHSNEQFEKYISKASTTNADGTINDIKLRYLDVRWSNICNFKCRSCGSTYSSSWAQEQNKENVFMFAGGKNNDDLYDQFKKHFNTIEEFYFAGGEPLLMDKHYDILEYLVEHGRTDVKLRYNTNLSVLTYKNKSVLDLWKKFDRVFVGASLDHYGNRAEYIREGTNWSIIENNLRRIRLETPNVELQTNTVVSIFNVSTLPEFIQYLLENELVDGNIYNPNFYNIMNPDFYSYQLLSENLKNETIEKLKSFMSTQRGNIQYGIRTVINGLQSSSYTPELKHKFYEITNHYDKIRNKDFIKTFPELEQFYKDCKNIDVKLWP